MLAGMRPRIAPWHLAVLLVAMLVGGLVVSSIAAVAKGSIPGVSLSSGASTPTAAPAAPVAKPAPLTSLKGLRLKSDKLRMTFGEDGTVAVAYTGLSEEKGTYHELWKGPDVPLDLMLMIPGNQPADITWRHEVDPYDGTETIRFIYKNGNEWPFEVERKRF